MKYDYYKEHPKEVASKIKKQQFVDLFNSFADIADEDYDYLTENDKVILDYEKMTSHKNYKDKTDSYKLWIENNKDKVFTVEYCENHKKNPILVCLKEDETNPKWVIWDCFLKRVEE